MASKWAVESVQPRQLALMWIARSEDKRHSKREIRLSSKSCWAIWSTSVDPMRAITQDGCEFQKFLVPSYAAYSTQYVKMCNVPQKVTKQLLRPTFNHQPWHLGTRMIWRRDPICYIDCGDSMVLRCHRISLILWHYRPAIVLWIFSGWVSYGSDLSVWKAENTQIRFRDASIVELFTVYGRNLEHIYYR